MLCVYYYRDIYIRECYVFIPIHPIIIRFLTTDTEQKSKNNSRVDSPCQTQQEEIRQLNAIADLSQDALEAQVSILPGCRDKYDRSIVYISLKKMQLQNVNATHLAETLLYFQSIPKRETMCLGFLVLVDGRDAPWDELYKAFALVEESLPGTISLVLGLPTSNPCQSSLSSIFHLKFESISNENQLLTYISRDQLLVEYGGLYHYDHEEWIQFHKFLDPFIVSCHQMGCRLVELIQDLREGCLPSVLTKTLIEQQRKQIMDVLGDKQLKYLESEGSDFLKQLEKWQEKFQNNPDYEEALEKSKSLFKQLKKVVQKLEKLANKRLNRLQECMMVKMFEKESSQILAWLNHKGEETLKKHKTLAESLNSIREQEQDFEKFYFLAMRQIERGNDLLEEIPKVKENGISSTLKYQLDDFTERLEDAREKLEDTSRCYQLLDKAYEWCLESMRFVSHLKLDLTDSVSKRLRSYLQEHPYLEDDFFEEMLQLANRLNNPSLLEQCQASKVKFEETVELIRTRQRILFLEDEDTEKQPSLRFKSVNKPCLWNPSRNTSQTYLNCDSVAGSYTSFPSSYRSCPSGGGQRRRPQNRSQYAMAKRGSLTEEMMLARSRDYLGEVSRSFSLTGDNLNDETSSDRNWRACEEEMQRFADAIREQNDALRQKTLEDYRLQNSTGSKQDELEKPAHLTRCASCSDFEELLSIKSSPLENVTNNRILMMIVREMIQTERDYVKSLAYIIENYVPMLQTKDVCQSLRSQRNVVFGNIEKIFEFHSCYFLQELEQCESDPYSIGKCFLKHESQFYLYALYNKNKPKSDSLMAEYGNNFFKEKQQELGDKMNLASYLLKPVQRIGKYALLLKELIKECPQINSEHYNNLKAAEEMVRFQLRHGNDLLAMDALKECDVNIKEQGRLLRQDEFLVGKGGKRKTLRRVFLFEDLIIFSKAISPPDSNDYYQYKSSMKTSDLGLTAQVGESPTKFEIWFRKCKVQDLLVLQAPSAEIKNAWVEEITGLLWKQAERNRNLRLEEMSSMGVGNKPCLDITPSQNQICDRSISFQQLIKMPRFRNSVVISSTDNLNNNEQLRRRSFGGSSIFYDNSTPFYDTEEIIEDERVKSITQQSQCSAESGIFTDLSTSGDSYVENVQRMKMVERSDSLISRSSYDPKKEISTTTESSFSGLKAS
nr:puratrophin-1 [Parasteatoda tepidariorum]